MFRCRFPELKFLYHSLFDNNSKISLNEIRSCPRFRCGEEYWNFDFYRNNSSLSIKVIRCQSLRDVLLKTQVTVSDEDCSIAKYFSKQFECKENRNLDISYELAVLNEFYFKDTIDGCNQHFDVNIELILYEIATNDVETELLKVEDKSEVQRLLSEDILKMYDNKTETDCVLSIRGEEIHAHKSVLCASSPVFAKIFQKKKAKGHIVNIEDMDVDTMKKLVDYMYSRVNFNCDFDEAMDMYLAADKYGLLQLREKCGRVIVRKINDGNVISALLLADRHEDYNLKKATMEMINSNLKSCVKEEWWDDFFARDNSDLYKELINFLQ